MEQPPHLVEGGRPNPGILGGQPPEATSYSDRAGGRPPAMTGLVGRPPAGTGLGEQPPASTRKATA
jgi:hypothetical protein